MRRIEKDLMTYPIWSMHVTHTSHRDAPIAAGSLAG